MFNFLKDKLKTWLGKSKDKIEEKPAKSLKEKSKKEKEISKPIKEKKKVGEKPQKKLRTREEVKEERKTTEKVFQDIKKEDLELKTPEEKFERVIREEADKEEKIKKDEKELEQIEEEIKDELIEETTKEEKPEKKGFFSKLKSFLAYNITEDDFEYIFDDLEMLLLENNVALEVVEEIKKKLKEELLNKEIKKQDIEDEIKKALKKAIEEILIEPEDTIKEIKDFKKLSKEPYKILFFGINGAGKTTGIAKLTSLILKNKLTCVIAAADTFRAAAIEQIEIHANKLGVKLIKSDYQSDPSAVAFDAIKYAKTNHIDVVLIDTAGRMHTKENLLQEMEKICRVTKPNLKVFVAEAIAGNDATEQAKAFNDLIGVDGSILSKTDIDEKGGTILSIGFITKKPILYLGVGQKYEDLELFSKAKFIKNLGF